MLIRTTQRYFGLNKETINELLLVDCETLQPATEEQAEGEELALYFGTTMVNVIGLDEMGRQVEMPPQEITFPISATSRVQAFSMFESAARDYVNFLKEEHARQQRTNNLYVPNQEEVNRLSKIITPS